MAYLIMLSIAAFWLGACPFSVWVGRWLLRCDITQYGDHNPGATNVFRAGGRVTGFLAVFLDMGKGAPFVYLSSYVLNLGDVATYTVGLFAIMGHAFSPLLGFRGGKSTAVTGGVLAVLPQHELFIACLMFIFLYFLALESDEWRVVLMAFSTLVYVIVTDRGLAEVLFMLCVGIILTVKNFGGLHSLPRYRRKLSIRFG